MEKLTKFHQEVINNPGSAFVMRKNGSLYWLQKAELKHLYLVPGSFNPLHETHKEIYEHALKNMGKDEYGEKETLFEISIERIGKEPLSVEELEKRLQQFAGRASVTVNKAPRFVEKIGIYLSFADKVTFFVGIDCVIRMKDDYGDTGIQGFASNFVVYDRIVNGKHMNLQSVFPVQVPKNCSAASMARTLESLSRSSTKIRNG